MLLKTTHCSDQQSRSFNRGDEHDQRITRENDTGSWVAIRKVMTCAKRSENQRHQPLGQVRGDREEHSSAIIHDQSEFTVTRELSKEHGSSENGVKTRATTTKETARTSKEFLTKKSAQIPAKELSQIEEEQNEWENEKLPPMMNTSQLQGESEEEAVSKKTPEVLSIQRKANWLRNKDNKKTLRESNEESNGSGLPSYHTSWSSTSSSESEGDIIEYEASPPSQPRA